MTSGLRWILIQRPIEADVYFVGYAYPVTTHWLIHPLFACADADSATATSCDHLRPPVGGPLSLPALSQADPPHTDPTFPTADHISTPLRQRGSHKHS
ncbi:hypothetical protein BHE74_00020383 [Ensete ventricosum]|nr:hypothetical protein GW17_00025363 [Ensete ventricosum]RWW71845.1 hypothetical protein BHE74_00020383 [Ensete ventricosum]RZR85234.1 hypothetical protein BHM03_00012188 [Ensete ventricosum]